ncbi:MAG TPA: hypothetical protein VIS06_12640 [Mycobacteriales bacterium]
MTAPVVAYAESWTLDGYLARLDPRVLGTTDGRRAATRHDPLLFALVYLRHHLRDGQGRITFSDFHIDAYRRAREWTRPSTEPATERDAYVAPRESGKSTVYFLTLPLWAAAHGHRRFIAAFSDSANQAEGHLRTFKAELDGNDLLRHDFPDLCTPSRRRSGQQVADNQGMLHSKSGFTFAARGVGAGVLGLKVGATRPDLIVLDDIEPGEENYSPYQAGQRLKTLQDVILPLNIYARVVLVGTVTMAGSIVHQLVQSLEADEPAEPWVRDEQFRVHHYQPIIVADDGTERSMWEAKWPIAWLLSIRHTRSYAKNMANDPRGSDGDYWTSEDITYGRPAGVARWLLSVDPKVSTKKSSDFVGLAVVGFSPSERRCVVEHAEQVRFIDEALRTYVLRILERFPQVRLLLIEDNQGGELWYRVFHDMPVRIKLVHQSEPKEVRAGKTLAHYQARPVPRVVHDHEMPAVEAQMVGFPAAPHDDMVDAIGTGVLAFLEPKKTRSRAGVTYVDI